MQSGGDGIIITGCNRTHIQNVQSWENNRQGLSIINARDLVVEDSEFSRTNGTSPAAGIDIEPDCPGPPGRLSALRVSIIHFLSIVVLYGRARR